MNNFQFLTFWVYIHLIFALVGEALDEDDYDEEEEEGSEGEEEGTERLSEN